MIRRRQPRMKGILPVRICGIKGEPFCERCCTATISSAGASLLGVRAPVFKGDIIELQYGTRQASFRVVWTHLASAAGERHVGLECLQPEKKFWPVTLPGDGRPAGRRFPVSGTAYVSKVGADVKSPAKIGDISLGGCYLETSRPDVVGRRLELWMRIGHSDLQALGIVRVRHPQIGMGIEFTFMGNADRRKLERLVANLTNSLEK